MMARSQQYIHTRMAVWVRFFDGVFHKGVGSVAERNFRPHVSCVKTTPEGKYVCAVDNGIDQVKIYRINTTRNRMELVDILRCKREFRTERDRV